MTIGALPCLTNRIAARTAFVLICLLGPVSERAPVRLVGTAQAQVATQPQTQTVQASSYTMPPGAVPPPVMGPPVTIPRPGSPLSDAELERLKNLPGGPPTPGATPIPPARSQAPQPNAAQPPDVVTTCPTNSTDGGGPPDIIGAAGPFTIVVTTNVSIGVYSTDCHLSSKVSLKDFFGPTGVASNETLFDSRVIYDPGVGRFFVTSESATTFKGDPTDYQNQYFAVSQDQTGTSWWLYKVVLKSPSTLFCVQANALWDFPSAGSMNGAKPRWFITANQVPGLGRLLSIPKTPTLSGQSVTPMCLTQETGGSALGNMAPPIVQDASDTAYFLANNTVGDEIARFAYNSSSDTITRTAPISVLPYSPPPRALQPNFHQLDTSDGRFASASIQNGTSLWNVHSINVNNYAVGRLYHFSTTGTIPVFTKDLFTSATDYIFNLSVATNTTHAFVTASRTDPFDRLNGNAAMLVFHGSNSSDRGWTFDVVATSLVPMSCVSDCRWGDYSATQIDPSDNTKAWGFNELSAGPSEGDWTTRAALVTAPAIPCIALDATHDFNGDCRSDIAWRDANTDTVAGWLMNGLQVLQSDSYGVVANNWTIVGQRDFDGDGKHDFLWRDANSGTVAIWLLNGLSILQTGSLAMVPANWVIAGTGDFNGDGKGDILWRDANTGTLAIWLLNGLQISQSGSLGAVLSNWTIVGTGDFDGDGKADILWRDNNTGTVAIWLMNGLQVSQSGGLGAVPSNWTIVDTGDFNGDGKSDILWHDTNSGTVATWLMNGLSVLQTGSFGAIPANWVIVETGDFNGDGKADILWREMTGGAVGIWLLNGLSVLQTGGVGTVALNWAIQGANAD